MKASILSVLCVALLALASCVHVSESGEIVWGEGRAASTRAAPADERQSSPKDPPLPRPADEASAHARWVDPRAR